MTNSSDHEIPSTNLIVKSSSMSGINLYDYRLKFPAHHVDHLLILIVGIYSQS
jgi:hypothetical protein